MVMFQLSILASAILPSLWVRGEALTVLTVLTLRYEPYMKSSFGA